MQIWFIFSLVFALIVAAFAALNSDVVTINFLMVEYQLSQSAVIILSAVIGACVAAFLGVFSRIKSGLKIRELTVSLKNAEKENEKLTGSVRDHVEKDNIVEAVSNVETANDRSIERK